MEKLLNELLLGFLIEESEKETEKCFGELLFNKFSEAGFATEFDAFRDGSGSWVEIYLTKTKQLNISLDGNGEHITDVGLFKDIIDVVDNKKIWKYNSPKNLNQ